MQQVSHRILSCPSLTSLTAYNAFSALFTLLEFMLRSDAVDAAQRTRILHCIEETSLRALTFAEAAYTEREESYPFEIHTPFLPYSLCQAAVVQYRMWRQTGNILFKDRLDKLTTILREFTQRWMVACKLSSLRA